MVKTIRQVKIQAHSQSLRKAARLVAEQLTETPAPTGDSPSRDFRKSLELALRTSDQRALDWYRRGLEYGMRVATDLICDGTLVFADGWLTAPGATREQLVVKRWVKLKGRARAQRTFRIKLARLGFDTK